MKVPAFIVFLDKAETTYYLLQDNDLYISSMTIPDIIARGCKTHNEYLKKASESAMSFSEDEKILLEKSILDAQFFLKNLSHPFIKPVLLDTFSWKIALTSNIYENGLPHTREDIIFLSQDSMKLSSADLTKLLIHEYIHIYQRKNKSEFQFELLKRGYISWKKRNYYPRIRSNPDLDEYIYIHPNGTIMLTLYKSDTPKDINDIVQPNHNYEHPNEEIAYEIANKYKV